MKLLMNCREVSTLVLQGQDRRLSMPERLSLRLHWRMCRGCQRFANQARLMQQAMGRWRSYQEK